MAASLSSVGESKNIRGLVPRCIDIHIAVTSKDSERVFQQPAIAEIDARGVEIPKIQVAQIAEREIVLLPLRLPPVELLILPSRSSWYSVSS